MPAAVELTPDVVPEFRWILARLTAAGALDTGFGEQGFVTLPAVNAHGFGVAPLPVGAVAVVGRDQDGLKLTRVTSDGKLDPAFGAGAPVPAA